MACRVIAAGPGFTAIACGPRARQPACSTPSCRNPAGKACDYPVTLKGVAGTCDARLCELHAKSVGPDVDWCPSHVAFEARKAGVKP
jgi:hypothetical protein